jgi:hypothetical protein
MNESDVREGANDALSLGSEHLCGITCRDKKRDLVQVLFTFVIGERDSLVGEIPMEAEVGEGVSEFLALVLVPRNTQWSYQGFDRREIVTV